MKQKKITSKQGSTSDIQKSGSDLNALAEKKKIQLENYFKTIRYIMDRSIHRISDTEKEQYLNLVQLMKTNTPIGYISAEQFSIILERRRVIPDLMERLYKTCCLYKENILDEAPWIIDSFIRYVNPHEKTNTEKGTSYFTRAWTEIIPRLNLNPNSVNNKESDKNLIKDLQETRKKYIFNAVLKASNSQHPIEYKKALVQLILKSKNESTINLIFQHLPIYNEHELSIIIEFSLLFMNNNNYAQLLFFLLDRIPASWYTHLSKTLVKYDFRNRFHQLSYLFKINHQMFDRYDWAELGTGRKFEEDLKKFTHSNPDKKFNPLVFLMWEIMGGYSIAPYFRYRFIYDLQSEREKLIFEWILSGKNLSKYNDLPINITSRQAHFLSNYESEIGNWSNPLYYQLKNYPLYRLNNQIEELEDPNLFSKLPLNTILAWIRCLDELYRLYEPNYNIPIRTKMTMHPVLAIELKIVLMKIHYNFNVNVLDWAPVIPSFIFANSGSIRVSYLNEVLDYIQNAILLDNHPADFKTKKMSSWRADSDAWHQKVLLIEYYKEKNYRYPLSGVDRIELNHEGEQYVIEQIPNPKELFDEGQAMKHCVSTYDNGYRNQQYYIFRVLKLNNEKFIPCLTLQIILNNDNVSINQVRGMQNRVCTISEKNMLNLWIEAAKFQLKHKLEDKKKQQNKKYKW